MVRSTLVPTLLLAFSLSARAQVKLGLEAGPDFPRLLDLLHGYNGSGQLVTLNSQSITRFSGGIFADVPLGKKFVFRPKLEYLGAGGSNEQITDYNGNELVAATKYTLNYINVPVQLLYSPSFYFGRLFIGGGFYSGILLNGKIHDPNGTMKLFIGNDPAHDAAKRFDLGFTGSTGFSLKEGVLISLDFQQGFMSITQPKLYFGGYGLSTRNSIWSVHFGYEWKLKHPH